MVLSDYNITETIYESENSVVFKAQRDSQPVVIKMLNEAYPTPERIARFRREYELTKSLNADRVIDVYELGMQQHQPFMVLQDFGAVSLDRHLAQAEGWGLGIETFLHLAIETCKCLDQVHRGGLIHKDISPGNILYNPETRQVKLIDFGISSVLSRERSLVVPSKHLEGTFLYMSPEQTGRLNRLLDYRTDFYSLGATFYELLVGQAPFAGLDEMALIHCHLTQEPKAPHDLRADVPEVLSEIVLTLLRKNAEERYQSVDGLLADLQRCQDQVLRGGKVGTFVLKQGDFSAHFEVSQTLYGREEHCETLRGALGRICEGQKELVMVAGYAGVGKTTLVHTLDSDVAEAGGYFISGKFDPLKHDQPYEGLTQAFQSLVQRVLTESEEEIEAWKTRLSDGLGANGQVIVDVIPELVELIGPQPSLRPLQPDEARNRFQVVFRQFIGACAQREHPLILFLDDLQWADTSSLTLIETFLNAPEARHVLIIGAYRDNEVDAAHPVSVMMDNLTASGAVCHRLLLEPLGGGEVNRLIGDTFDQDLEQTQPLAERVYEKTQGNPFFLNQFLYALYDASHIVFDRQQKRWVWHLEQIDQVQVTDNVVDLVVERMRQLPADTQQVLKLAAYLGNRFDLQTLAWVHQKALRDTAVDLEAAWREGLIYSTDHAHKYVAFAEDDANAGSNPRYAFVHDRVQQAGQSLVDAEAVSTLHLHIGRLLLAHTKDAEEDERLFEIVNHLNQASELIDDVVEKDRLLDLNLVAGKRAKDSAAYEPAYHYLIVCLSLLGDRCWADDFARTLEVYESAVEAAYLSTNFEDMERLIAVTLENTDNVLDQVKVYEIRGMAYMAQTRPMDTIENGLQILRLLGVKLPSKPKTVHVISALMQVQFKLRGKSPDHLYHLPEMTDPHKIAAMRIAKGLYPAAFIASPNLFALLVFKMVRLSLRYGNMASSPMAYMAYAYILSTTLGKAKDGHDMGNMALRLVDKLEAEDVRAASLTLQGMVDAWSQPLQKASASQKLAYRIGMMTGDFEYASYAAMHYMQFVYLAGRNLNEIEPEFGELCRGTMALGQDSVATSQKVCWQAVCNLLGHNEVPWRLNGAVCGSADKIMADFAAAEDGIAICFLQLNVLMLGYLFGQLDEAHDADLVIRKYSKGLDAEFFPACNFYASLTMLALCNGLAKDKQKSLLKQVAQNQKRLRKWANQGPDNCAHKYDLVAAEQARVLGNREGALTLYKQAIDQAHKAGFLNEEALSYELCAKFWLERGDREIAKVYMTRAHHVYQVWGAVAKVKDLENRYAEFLDLSDEGDSESHLASTQMSVSSDALDLTSVMKAGQVLSGEMALAELLRKLMQVVLENAGAQTGVLVLKKQDAWFVEAEKREDEVQVLQSKPLDELAHEVPQSVIAYVARTGDSVVLDQAGDEGLFTGDPYVVQHQIQSMLCMPLYNQARMVGILYLENNVMSGAFTEDRIEVLNLLVAQAAISIENAGLYSNLADANEQLEENNQTLEHRVAERTEDLEKRTAELEKANRELQQAILRQKQAESDLDRTERSLKTVAAQEAARWGVDEIRGESETLKQILKQVELLQSTDATSVLIVGESGTGKELVARAIHYGGPRAHQPFVPVNCSAIPADLMETFFFGHTKGAFTGASQKHEGFFIQADGGTLFLDELGDMPVELQAKLLRVLEDGVVMPVGGTKPQQVDVRVLGATNADLHQRIEDGRFRQDFYYRLARAVVAVPPLRERVEDIPVLADHFLGLLSQDMGLPKPQFSDEAMKLLQTYDFPGNIRELKNVIEFALIQNGGTTVLPAHLQFSTTRSTPSAMPVAPSVGSSAPVLSDEQEIEQLILKYVQTHGEINNSECRDLLGVDRRRASYLLEKLCAAGRLKRTGSRRWARYKWGTAT